MLLKVKKKIIRTKDCLWTSMHYAVSFLSERIFRTLPIVWLIKKKKNSLCEVHLCLCTRYK